MKILKILKKLPFVFFSLVMIYLFFTGLYYPKETDFWILKNSLPIIVFDFFSIFVSMIYASNFLMGRIVKSQNNRVNVEPLMLVVILSVLPLVFSIAFGNILLFGYFIVSSSIKYFNFVKIKGDVDSKEKIKNTVIIPLSSIILSMFITFFSISFITGFFSNQKEIIASHIFTYDPLNIVSSDNAFFFGFWGLLYFTLPLIFDLVGSIYKGKTGRSMVTVYR